MYDLYRVGLSLGDVVRVENGVDRGKLFEKEKQEEEEERQLAGVGSCGCIIDTCNRSSHSSSVFEILINYIYINSIQFKEVIQDIGQSLRVTLGLV